MRNAGSLVLTVIDGRRPDTFGKDRVPGIDGFRPTGASIMTAQTVMPSTTLPGHDAPVPPRLTQDHPLPDPKRNPLKALEKDLCGLPNGQSISSAFLASRGPMRRMSPQDLLTVSLFRKVRKGHDASTATPLPLPSMGPKTLLCSSPAWNSPAPPEPVTIRDGCRTHSSGPAPSSWNLRLRPTAPARESPFHRRQIHRTSLSQAFGFSPARILMQDVIFVRRDACRP